MSLLRRAARRGLALADNFCARLSSGLLPEAGSLAAVLFHSLYRNEAQLRNPTLAPGQDMTVEAFRRFTGVLLDSGYTPVSPGQVEAGLAPGGNYVMITFDDGYFNNTLALDVLAQFHAPATFFISSDHVLQNKGFWWDAFSRELAEHGAGDRARNAEIRRVKSWSSQRIEDWLRQRYGQSALTPRGDLDRPFRPDELRDFSREKWVHIGNHTRAHAILTDCTPTEMARQIAGCQADLKEITGRAPIAIAYPNGGYSRTVVNASRAAGLSVGLTVRPCVNRLALDDEKSRMTLGRFLVSGCEDFQIQCRKMNSGFIPSNRLKVFMTPGY
jgi:peptidoglycan/xylan/chitin deacetylase (PgdA/CDA1 family)